MSLVVLILLLSSSLSGAVIYKRTGGEVVIPTGSAASRITSITWKHNDDIAVEWYREESSAYRHFNGHTSLDTLTGDLTISGLTREHSGSYTAEINNKVAGTTEIQVISPVPKPTVSKRCNAEMTSCTLTCEGNTMDAEPVTYSWQTSDENSYYEIQQITVTKEDRDCWFHCEMKNPISAETSEEFENPFSSISECKRTIFVAVGILILLLMVLVIGILIYCKWKSKKGKEVKGTDEEMKRVLEVSRNGVTPSVSIEETLNQASHVSSVVFDICSQTATTTSEGQEAFTSVAQNSNESVTDSKDQNTSRNDLKTAASPETEESTEESNGKETTGPLLEERNESISASAT